MFSQVLVDLTYEDIAKGWTQWYDMLFHHPYDMLYSHTYMLYSHT